MEQCPQQWGNYVAEVREQYLSERDETAQVLFVDTEGHVWNCLNQDVGQDELVKLAAFELEFSEFVSFTGRVDEEGWPPNLCSYSEVLPTTTGIRMVYLPFDEEVLESSSCNERVSRLWRQ